MRIRPTHPAAPRVARRRLHPFAALAVAALLSAACAKEPAQSAPPASDASPAAALPATTAALQPADREILAAQTMTVHKDANCGCCKKWVEYLQGLGVKVVALDHDQAEMQRIKQENGVRPALQSCHTATIGSYVIEGHVPAEDIARLLRETPAVAGLAVPGMPMGSPGMEGPVKDAYDVLTFDKSGATTVFSKR